jgi:hypothetical protein
VTLRSHHPHHSMWLGNGAAALARAQAADDAESYHRYLQTLLEIGGSNSSTIIFPAPIDLISPFFDRAERNGGARPA